MVFIHNKFLYELGARSGDISQNQWSTNGQYEQINGIVAKHSNPKSNHRRIRKRWKNYPF